jgi:superfamily II DNA or RNA helicase
VRVNERRRFNDSERAALYLAADGHCTNCGTELQPGWHGDHMEPYSLGGQTDVINGQALCPPCNLKKGSKVTGLRAWQDAALAQLVRTDDDFLAVACPGAGKTTFALVAAQRLIDLGAIRRIIVVVPTAHLRKQWATAATRFGIQLDHRFVNGSAALARDFDGLVVTYAAVASEPLLYRKLAAESALVILDEIHHGGDELAWGTALKTAFEVASRRLLLSGTPTRTDRAAVPFIRYDERGMFVAEGGHGYTYDYGEAIRDHAVRPIEFLALDGSVRWREAGAIVATDLASTDETTLVNALNAALNPEGEWIGSVLRRADAELARHRTDVPDAGGLVVAADQYRARRYAAILHTVTGEEPTLAITEEPDSSDRITAFSKPDCTSRWLVAVQMVSEGVDIPRLAVGVYASRVRTEMFFRQVVGRFVRMRSAEDETTATLLIPSIEPLLGYAQKIEKTVDAALRQEENMMQREMKDRNEQLPLMLDLVEPIDSSEAVHHSTILSGEAFSDEELRRAANYIGAAGMPASVTAAHVARLLRLAGAGRVVGTATLKPEASAHPPNLADEKASMRRLLKRKVGRLNRLSEKPHSYIHAELNRICQDTAVTATAETLAQRLTILDNWIEQAAGS